MSIDIAPEEAFQRDEDADASFYTAGTTAASTSTDEGEQDEPSASESPIFSFEATPSFSFSTDTVPAFGDNSCSFGTFTTIDADTSAVSYALN